MTSIFLLLSISCFYIHTMDNLDQHAETRSLDTQAFIAQPAGESTQNRLQTNTKTFATWYNQCKKLPNYKQQNNAGSAYAVDLLEALDTFKSFVSTMNQSSLNQTFFWLPGTSTHRPSPIFFDFDKLKLSFEPYVQKLLLPSQSVIAVHGDLHGDIHSLNEYILFLQSQKYLDANDAFSIQDPNFHMLFLGDYVDKGLYGLEVLYTLMRLKIANPTQVHLVRGNHEDITVNVHQGFYTELYRKFSSRFTQQQISEHLLYLSKLYTFMPVALYLGSGALTHNYIQCCHGGMELGYNPQRLLKSPSTIKYQLLTTLNRASESATLDCELLTNVSFANIALISKKSYSDIGFLWSDFIVDPEGTIEHSSRGDSIYSYGKKATAQILENASSKFNRVRGVFRGHQHSNQWDPLMELLLDCQGRNPENVGIAKLWQDTSNTQLALWDGIVCTFLVSPQTPYGVPSGCYPGFNFDAFGIVTTADTFDQWKLSIHRTYI